MADRHASAAALPAGPSVVIEATVALVVDNVVVLTPDVVLATTDIVGVVADKSAAVVEGLDRALAAGEDLKQLDSATIAAADVRELPLQHGIVGVAL